MVLAIRKLVETLMGRGEKHQHQHQHGRSRHTSWVFPLNIKRVVIDGKEYWVRNVLSVSEDAMVVEELDGTIRTIRLRSRSSSSP